MRSFLDEGQRPLLLVSTLEEGVGPGYGVGWYRQWLSAGDILVALLPDNRHVCCEEQALALSACFLETSDT